MITGRAWRGNTTERSSGSSAVPGKWRLHCRAAVTAGDCRHAPLRHERARCRLIRPVSRAANFDRGNARNACRIPIHSWRPCQDQPSAEPRPDRAPTWPAPPQGICKGLGALAEGEETHGNTRTGAGSNPGDVANHLHVDPAPDGAQGLRCRCKAVMPTGRCPAAWLPTSQPTIASDCSPSPPPGPAK